MLAAGLPKAACLGSLAGLLHIAPSKCPVMSKFGTAASLPYATLVESFQIINKILIHPLTLSEKILYSHLYHARSQEIKLGVSDAIGVMVTQLLSGWTIPTAVILKVDGILTVNGGTGSIVTYFDPGVESMSSTSMASVRNMCAEIVAITSVFPYGGRMKKYLEAKGRAAVAQEADKAGELVPDKGATYDRLVEINLSELEEPHVNEPFTPDLTHPISKLGEHTKQAGWQTDIKVGLIGSCTISSYEVMTRVASIARVAISHGLKYKISFQVTPRSEQSRPTTEQHAFAQTLREFWGTVLANPYRRCIGQCARSDGKKGEKNPIVSSYNRDFTGRNYAYPARLAFVTSPELVAALSIAGRLDFDQKFKTPSGKEAKLSKPIAAELRSPGFDPGEDTYQAPGDGSKVSMNVSPSSNRSQLLDPCKNWQGTDLDDLAVSKIKGKRTTDHILARGPWLKFRSHLDNIYNNLFIGDINIENNEAKNIRNIFRNQWVAVPDVARNYKAKNQGWVAVGDDNYGAVSSREHSVLESRKGRTTIVKSPAGVHASTMCGGCIRKFSTERQLLRQVTHKKGIESKMNQMAVSLDRLIGDVNQHLKNSFVAEMYTVEKTAQDRTMEMLQLMV